jgi:hypothetical protein
MASFVVILFFALTGLTLNHPAWFAATERAIVYRSTLDPEWTNRATVADVPRLEIAEELRSAHGIRGEVRDFRVEEREIRIAFRAPGYSADAVIERKTGGYELTVSRAGFGALFRDLHTGRNSGPVWTVVIDLSAALLAIGSLIGLGLSLALRQHSVAGLAALVGGGAIVCALYAFWVP